MEWIRVEHRLPNVFSGKFKVENSNGDIFDCYFYADKMSWIGFYGEKPTYWWNSKTRQPVFDVIKWKEDYNLFPLD